MVELLRGRPEAQAAPLPGLKEAPPALQQANGHKRKKPSRPRQALGGGQTRADKVRAFALEFLKDGEKQTSAIAKAAGVDRLDVRNALGKSPEAKRLFRRASKTSWALAGPPKGPPAVASGADVADAAALAERRRSRARQLALALQDQAGPRSVAEIAREEGGTPGGIRALVIECPDWFRESSMGVVLTERGRKDLLGGETRYHVT
jgi:hypothetical protein